MPELHLIKTSEGEYRFPMLGQECSGEYPEDGPCEHTKAGGGEPKQSVEPLDVCELCGGTGIIAVYTVAGLALARKTLNGHQSELFMTYLVGPWQGSRATMEWFLNLTEDERINYLRRALEAAVEKTDATDKMS